MQLGKYLQKKKMRKISNLFRKKEITDLALDCEHSWLLFAKNYAAPRREIPEGLNDSLAEKAVMGVTTYLWNCSVCGNIRQTEVLGSDGSQLEEVLDKAEKLGVQYVERKDRVFAIAQVPADDSRIPVK